jgi:hypothetical protein
MNRNIANHHLFNVNPGDEWSICIQSWNLHTYIPPSHFYVCTEPITFRCLLVIGIVFYFLTACTSPGYAVPDCKTTVADENMIKSIEEVKLY